MKTAFIITADLHYHTGGSWTADISLQSIRAGKHYGSAAHWQVKSDDDCIGSYDKFIRLVRTTIAEKVLPISDS